MSQSKKEAVWEFLTWGLDRPLPVVLTQKNRGILGQVPSQNIGALLDECFGKEPKEERKPREPRRPRKPKAEEPKPEPKTEEAPVAPPLPPAYGKGEAPDEVPNPASGAPVPPKGE